MFILLLFSFLAGIITVLSPCILPVLPLVLSSGLSTGKHRPLGVVLGFVGSFTFFTLFLTQIVQATNISADSVRSFAIIMLIVLGFSLILPQWQKWSEKIFSLFANRIPQPQNTHGFGGGVLLGISLGLIWTPCVGPILASVISLALTGTVQFETFLITLAYSLGTALPLFLIIAGGQHMLTRFQNIRPYSQVLQKIFGGVMIGTALIIALQIDRAVQTWILTQWPEYGTQLTRIEDTPAVQKALEKQELGESPMSFFGNDSLQKAPEIIAGGAWFNTEPLTLAQLRGKVVLVDFWTYTCINCIRTLPYLQRWHETYEKDGLVILGVHTPEFEFEKNPENVQKALTDFGLTYPVMQDNDYATWRAYNNRYWPAKYLIDAKGTIRYTHFGEGEYDETESMIQKLLKEAGSEISQEVKNPEYQIRSRTPETYLGWQRMESLASPERVTPNLARQYTLPAKLPENAFALQGEWTLQPEYSLAGKMSALEISFESQEVFLVMRPQKAESTPSVKVLIDGEVASVAAGSDVQDGTVQIETDRLYRLIKLDKPGRHILRLEFPEGGVEAFAFTFG